MRVGGFEVAFRPLEHLNLKVISLALALGLWSLVPDTTTPLPVRGVPVRLDSIPSDLALAEPFDVALDVVVVGPISRVRELIPGQLSPAVDLFGAHAGDNTYTLTPDDVPAPFGVEVQSVEPNQVVVRLEQKVRELRPVSAVVEGEPAAGYVLSDTSTDPAAVTVVGPRSRVLALESVATEVVQVSGQSETLRRRVAVVTSDPLVSIEGTPMVQLDIRISEIPVTLRLEDLPVEVLGATSRVAVNPERVGVVLRGPPSVLAEISAANLQVTLDVSGLEHRAEDYSVEPRVSFDPPGLGESVEVIALTPQSRIDVFVYQRP